jgi:hypothetical protein
MVTACRRVPSRRTTAAATPEQHLHVHSIDAVSSHRYEAARENGHSK